MNRILNLNLEEIILNKGTEGSAAYDLPLRIDETIFLEKKIKLIPTGIKLDLSPGFHAIIMSRSSSGIKKNILFVNGLIDSDYKGELFLQCYKNIDEEVKIEPNDCIAQLLLYKTENFMNDIKLIKTDVRGEGGFGSTH